MLEECYQFPNGRRFVISGAVEIFEVVNDRKKVIKILAMAKSAIRHNMSKDLPKIKVSTALIWGKDDIVTPPEVANEFNNMLVSLNQVGVNVYLADEKQRNEL